MTQSQAKTLLQLAIQAKENAYCPYSQFRVGCAIQLKDDTIIQGVNVENVSFGATNCAERTAIFTAVTQGYKPKSIAAIAVAGDTNDFLPPCSICRQVLVEFCDPDTPVYLTNNAGETYETNVEALVPLAFSTLSM